MSGQDDAFEGEWQEKWSETHNRVYYKNKITGERQWKKPAGMIGNNHRKGEEGRTQGICRCLWHRGAKEKWNV